MRYESNRRTTDERRRRMKKEKHQREEDTRLLTPQEAKKLLDHYCDMKPPYHSTAKDRLNLKRLHEARNLGVISREQFEEIPHIA